MAPAARTREDPTMPWYTIRLDLARSPDFPDGSPAHSYLLRLPLDAGQRFDTEAFAAQPARATVLRAWAEEPDRTGYVVRNDIGWAFSYEPGQGDDEGIYHLETHRIVMGEYVTITDADEEAHAFRIVRCDPLKE